MTINENVASWLMNEAFFWEAYRPLLVQSASSQLGKHFQTNILNVNEPDWPYLIYCASVLTNSKDSKAHEIALRIAQTAIMSAETSAVQRDSAIIILERLANYPSINLATQRQFIADGIEGRLPVYNLLKWTKTKFEHEILLGNGDIVLANSFQKDFWDTITNYQMSSLSAPTSAGKSYIIKQWIADRVKTSSKPLNIVFIVPTRALIFEVEKNFRDMLAGMGNVVNVSSSPLPTSAAKKKTNILVLTQERLQIFFNQKQAPESLDILVIDEAHKIGDSYRGVLLQHVIEKIIEASPNLITLFSSPLTENPKELLDDYEAKKNTKVFKTQENTVSQNLFWCSQLHGLPKKWEISLCGASEKLNLGILELEDKPSPESKRLSLIAYTIGKDVPGNIIYVDGAATAEKTAMQIYEFLGEEKQLDDTDVKDLIKLTKQQIHSEYVLATTLERGVAFHYGNMPDIIRIEIERLFSSGKIRFLICTSTLIEGVNTSCRNIFMRNPKKGRNKPMSRDDFWNLAGRAGRWGKEFQGNIFCIDPTEWENDGPPEKRTEFKIQRSTDRAIFSLDNLIAYMHGTYEGNDNKLFEYSFSYLYTQYKIAGSLLNTGWAHRFSPEILKRLDEVLLEINNVIEVPFDVFNRNPGISPNYINDLLKYFRDEVTGQKRDFKDFIPPTPDIDEAVELYTELLVRIARIFNIKDDIAFNGGHAWSNAIVIVGWMRGMPLSRIISNRIVFEKKKPAKKLAKLQKEKEKILGNKSLKDNAELQEKLQEVEKQILIWQEKIEDSSLDISLLIREVMEKVETVARFYAPKYLSVYADVLGVFLNESGQKEYAENLEEYGLLLEYGVTTETQIALITAGLTRATALALSEFIKDDSLNEDACISWLRKGSYRKFDLSKIMEREVEEVLKFIGEEKISA